GPLPAVGICRRDRSSAARPAAAAARLCDRRREPPVPVRPGEPHFLAEGNRTDRVLRRPRDLLALVDRTTQLPAGAGVGWVAAAGAPARLRPLRRPVRAGRGGALVTTAAKVHRGVRGNRFCVLPGRPDPLAALGLSVQLHARRARAVFLAQRGPRRPP